MKTQQYLDTGTRFVVKSLKAGQPAKWWTTTKPVTLPDGEFAGAVCPLTGQSVNWTVKDGFNLYFPARLIRVRIVLEDGDIDSEKLKDFKPVYLTYDIPDDAIDPDSPPDKPKRFKNPSDFLRRFAIRINKSDWLMDAGDLPLSLIAKMLDAGCSPKPVRLHPDDAKMHIEDAVLTMQREIVAKIASAAKSQRDAEVQLAKATEEAEGKATKTAEAAEKYYRQRAKSIERGLNEMAKDFEAALARFGLGLHVATIGQLTGTAATITDEMKTHADAYRTAANALRATGTTEGNALANLADADDLPVAIMAGALEDAGDDAGAAALMKAFTEPEAADADGTFSLADTDVDEPTAV